jgi:hypothetical protein
VSWRGHVEQSAHCFIGSLIFEKAIAHALTCNPA